MTSSVRLNSMVMLYLLSDEHPMPIIDTCCCNSIAFALSMLCLKYVITALVGGEALRQTVWLAVSGIPTARTLRDMTLVGLLLLIMRPLPRMIWVGMLRPDC